MKAYWVTVEFRCQVICDDEDQIEETIGEMIPEGTFEYSIDEERTIGADEYWADYKYERNREKMS